tara:strand:+ start:15292 stop:16659 length:1368 start_codon:yes stop_codon:yes gene_type:complete
MFIEKVKSEGLAHLSYVVGSAGHAAVVDPRRDCEIYIDIAASKGCEITHIFETHRNEDLVSGASALAEITGAKVYHGPDAAGEIVYASTVREDEVFTLGKAQFRVLQTPGHTDDSISLALYDTDFCDGAIAVFTGDALFVGDVGRTDFYPHRAHEVAGLLYDSLRKILSLGDQAIVYPAHGAGSVCGSGMADRDISTLGHERRNNPRLRIENRESFIEQKIAEVHHTPPYFKHMEALNLRGAPAFQSPPAQAPLTLEKFKVLQQESVVIDVRSASAFLGAHIHNSLALPVEMISSFAGWFVEPHQEIVLIAEDADHAALATRYLARIGCDKVQGFLAPSLVAWAAGGEAFGTLPVVDAATVKSRLASRPEKWELLDVRDEHEFGQASIAGARQLYVGEIQAGSNALQKEAFYTVMCGSGARATVAASVLLRAGIPTIDIFLGSMGAWKSSGYPTR